MTWRERITLAKTRRPRTRVARLLSEVFPRAYAAFSSEDEHLARSAETCAAAEYAAAYGLAYGSGASRLWIIGTDLHRAILYDQVDLAERLLDVIEDTALRLKRGGDDADTGVALAEVRRPATTDPERP